jgi:hypothetical protein
MKVNSKLQYEFVKDVISLLCFAQNLCEEGVYDRFVIGEVWRQPEMQRILKDRGFSKTLYGRHQDKLAIDLFFWMNGRILANVPRNKPHLQDMGDFWESRHPMNEWGGNWYHKQGDFIDLPHYERSVR